VKDRDNVVPEQPLPAWLGELAGVELVEIASVLDDGEARFTGVDGIHAGAFKGWYERIEPLGAHVLALYEDGDFAETPAITANAVGAGRVLYLAGAADLVTLTSVYETMASEAGLPTTELPEGVESVELRRNGETLVILLNHTDEERTVALSESRRELLSGVEHEQQVELAPFGVAVLVPVRAPVETT
jgi:beta-galactosidase